MDSEIKTKAYIETSMSGRKDILVSFTAKKYFQEGMASKNLIEVGLTAKEEL